MKNYNKKPYSYQPGMFDDVKAIIRDGKKIDIKEFIMNNESTTQKLQKIVELMVKKRLNESIDTDYNKVWKKLNNNYSEFTDVVQELDGYLMSIDDMVESGYPPKILSELVDIMISFTRTAKYKLAEGDHYKSK